MTAPVDEKGLLDRICHKEQIGIWANEVLTAMSLGDFLREEWSFDDTVDAEREIEAQLRSIIASAISHPEYDLMAKITSTEAQVLRLTEENEELRTSIATAEAVHVNMLRGGIPTLSIRQALHLHGAEALEKWDRAEAAEARIKALEEAFRKVLRSEYESEEPGLCDCIDNDGRAYQSQYLATAIAEGEALLALRENAL